MNYFFEILPNSQLLLRREILFIRVILLSEISEHDFIHCHT